MDDDDDACAAARTLLVRLRAVVRRDYSVASVSMFEAQVVAELRRNDRARMAAMVVMVVSVSPAVTPPVRKLQEVSAVEDHEWSAIRSFLSCVPRVVATHLRNEPNVSALLRDVREEMVLSAPLSLVVARPAPQTANERERS